MPRDSAGNYSLVAGNPVQSGEVVSSSWANNTLNDVAVALSDSLDRNGRGGMLAPFRFADGSVGLPGAAWTLETTTGFYRFDGGDLRVGVLTQDVMRWRTQGSQIWDNTNSVWRNIIGEGTGQDVTPGTEDDQSMRWDGTAWVPSSVLKIGGAGAYITSTTPRLDTVDTDGPDFETATGEFRTYLDDGTTVYTQVGPLSASSEDLYVRNQATAGGIRFEPAGTSSRMYVAPTGNVAIGNNFTTPERPMHIRISGGAGTVSSASTYLLVLDSGSDSTMQFRTPDDGEQYIRFSTPSSFGRAFIRYTGSNSLLTTQSDNGITWNTGGGTERMRLTNLGRLGIGVTAPSQTLHVLGDSGACARFESTEATTYIGIGASASTSWFNQRVSVTGDDITVIANTAGGRANLQAGSERIRIQDDGITLGLFTGVGITHNLSKFEVVTALPGTPDANTIYFVTG